MDSMDHYGVLIVGDSRDTRQPVKAIFEQDAQFVVTGIVKDGQTALDDIVACRPDLVVIDLTLLDMSEMTGKDGHISIFSMITHCPVPVVVLSTNTPEGSMQTIQAMRIGAADYFHKETLFQRPASASMTVHFMQRCKMVIQIGVRSIDGQVANDQFHKRMVLETHLRRAVANEEFHLVYQPVVDSTSGRIVGLESLIRWNNAQLGRVSPAEFIPVAEETGLIHEIGEWVLKEACKQNKKWQDAGLPKLSVAVNLSSRQFNDSRLSGMIQNILEETGLSPQYLELEITESMSMDVKAASTTLYELKKLGVQVAMDDFGTGYSSLGYLKDFPIDKMKIDQSFIKGLKQSQVNAAIVHTMITMAHNLNLLVVAEGVETEEELQVVRACGCRLVQGYYFSPPSNAEQIGELLQSYVCSTLA
ncbi:EAL domain-containing protein [Paenibacillus sp. SYP-B3998]|uniref:EAL domain-containing protein n=1 Tax=Paenibacillus sp. SYP-B3998 TaxID=2678564 RepID=A0A6G4A800_9BACL|nr:EAL domain-containing response regulator [Paenibacillus sp. SYP-B3998]NEW09747.1 EAL domain-containing protein [Paenibacillus sp. SYP-B3998]